METKKMFLNSAQVAELLGVSTRTLQRKRDNGKIKYYQDGRIIRYKMEDVEAYLNRCVMCIFNDDSGKANYSPAKKSDHED